MGNSGEFPRRNQAGEVRRSVCPSSSQDKRLSSVGLIGELGIWGGLVTDI